MYYYLAFEPNIYCYGLFNLIYGNLIFFYTINGCISSRTEVWPGDHNSVLNRFNPNQL